MATITGTYAPSRKFRGVLRGTVPVIVMLVVSLAFYHVGGRAFTCDGKENLLSELSSVARCRNFLQRADRTASLGPS